MENFAPRFPVNLYDTPQRRVRPFTPWTTPTVLFYTCGPTVYDRAHIGNLRAYIFADVLRRTLAVAGYDVHHVVNITDVGHLVGDGNDGEDKMTAGLKREGLPLSRDAMIALGKKFTDIFLSDIAALNILPPTALPRASDHIADDCALIETLTAKGHVYRTSDGLYFDTTTFPDYAAFARLDLSGQDAGARVPLGEKHSGADFALWKFNEALGFDSPFGKGFPGWHIECSAMIKKHLGHPIDIHTGGIDHIPVHHTNEVAQSVAAYGAPFVGYFLHAAHTMIDGVKMSKSLGNGDTLDDLPHRAEGATPLVLRYWYMTAHYRTQLNLTRAALEGAVSAYRRIIATLANFGTDIGTEHSSYRAKFYAAIGDDLNTAAVIALLWELLRDDTVHAPDKIATAFLFDSVLGLDLRHAWESACAQRSAPLPEEIVHLLDERKHARETKDWIRADHLRAELLARGWDVQDTAGGQVARPHILGDQEEAQ